LNHLYDMSRQKEKIEVHMHCPFYARIAKQKDPKNFSTWFERFDGKCTYFAFGGYLSVIENGDLIPCFYSQLNASEPIKVGNIRQKSLGQAWEEMQKSEFYRSVRDKNNLTGKCGVCEYRDICGGCRNRAYFYTGNFYGPDPACAYIPESLRK
jgi:radical SAM protein with 4Fe4S-binding SPASM domain